MYNLEGNEINEEKKKENYTYRKKNNGSRYMNDERNF